MADEEQAKPLLSSIKQTPEPSEISSIYGSVHSRGEILNDNPLRSIEDDVIPETATYGRNVTWASAYILVISRIIGSGIFAMPGAVVKSVGSVGISLMVWALGAIIAACEAMVTLEYGCMLPRSGGDKVYLEFTYRHPRYLASTMVAIKAVLLGFTASNCIVFGKYTLFALDGESTDAAQKLLAVGLLTFITIIHGCFLRTGILIQNALGWIKVVLIIFVALTGLYVLIFRPQNTYGPTPSADVLSWNELWRDSRWGWGILSTSIFKVSYSYAGLSNVNNVLNEVKNPVRTLKSIVPTALLTACILYLLVNLAYFVVVPLNDIKESGELISALFFSRVFGPGFGDKLLPLAIAISAAGNVMVVTFTLARVNQEIARQGFLPWARILSSSLPFNAPLGGLIVHYIPSVLVIVFPPSADVYAFIADVEGYPGQFFALATAVGLIWLRYKRPDLHRPFKAWLPAVWLRIAICITLIVAPFFPPADGVGDVSFFYATYAIVGIGILVLSVLYWYVWIIVIPRWKGYRIEDEVEVLEDGTSRTRLVHIKED
ncbi:MAG: hypothetical protein M1834_008910 [Cirrosporium novae-zelandiae]|nr:MAG: hypothetical protein M1834_008910 [Cirrosporium novae-zelandiae]